MMQHRILPPLTQDYRRARGSAAAQLLEPLTKHPALSQTTEVLSRARTNLGYDYSEFRNSCNWCFSVGVRCS